MNIKKNILTHQPTLGGLSDSKMTATKISLFIFNSEKVGWLFSTNFFTNFDSGLTKIRFLEKQYWFEI